MSALAKQADRLAPLAAYVLVAVGGLIMLAPFYFMFVFASHSRPRSSACRRPCFLAMISC